MKTKFHVRDCHRRRGHEETGLPMAANGADLLSDRLLWRPCSPPFPADAWAKGGFAVTQSKQHTDDFNFSIEVRIEGRNCKRLVVRAVGAIIALALVGARIALWLNGKPF